MCGKASETKTQIPAKKKKMRKEARRICNWIGEYGPAIVIVVFVVVIAVFCFVANACPAWVLVVGIIIVVAIVLEWTLVGVVTKKLYLDTGRATLRPKYDERTPLTIDTTGSPSAHSATILLATILSSVFVLGMLAWIRTKITARGPFLGLTLLSVAFVVLSVGLCYIVTWQRRAFLWHTTEQVQHGVCNGILSVGVWLVVISIVLLIFWASGSFPS